MITRITLRDVVCFDHDGVTFDNLTMRNYNSDNNN